MNFFALGPSAIGIFSDNSSGVSRVDVTVAAENSKAERNEVFLIPRNAGD